MYSLVSSAVLACDLARHPSGAAVADVVDRVLVLGETELGTPAAAAVRERVLANLAGAPRMSRLLDGVTATFSEGLPDAATSSVLLAALTETPLGGLEDLHRMLEGEGAGQVALDAVTVAWAGREADLRDLHELQRPWREAVDPVPPTPPAYPGLTELLDEIPRRSRRQWQRTADAHGAQRGTLAWSRQVHATCWAAFEAGLLTDVARAQLAAARALRLSGASTGEDAHAIAMAVTGAVQGLCTSHLLDTRWLLSAWEAGS
ncbi:MAG: uncharacterized protein JWO22_2838 [Frankiales bacterium]|nr:uncharacterized protein [Frankiales bacterium]